MNVEAVIEAVVRQSMVLVARLATVAGMRAPLARVGDQVFLELSRELRAQGVGGKVIADMFGLALRSYQAKVRRLSESATDRGRTLWEAVLGYIRSNTRVGRAELLYRFRYDDESTVRGVLNDLVESGLVYRTGRGDATAYRIADDAPDGEQGADERASWVWLVIHREGPLDRDGLRSAVSMDDASLDAALAELEADGRVQREADDEGAIRWRSDSVVIAADATAGLGAAMVDHYQAMITTLIGRLDAAADPAKDDPLGGGSTFKFDIWDGHPHAEEVEGLLNALRTQLGEVRARVDACPPDPVAPSAGARRLTFYCGQSVRWETPEG